jgi:ATP-binding cassette subfamily B protein
MRASADPGAAVGPGVTSRLGVQRGQREPGPNLGVLLRMAALLRPYRVRAVLGLVLGVAMVVFSTRLPLVLGGIIDNGVIRHRPGALADGVLLFLALALGRLACGSTRRAIGGSLGVDVEYDLRNHLARQVLALDAAWHDQADTGQLLARANSDVTAIRTFLGFGSVFSVLNTLTVAIALVQMWLLSARLTVVTLAFAPLLAIVSLRYNRQAHQVFTRVQQQIGKLTSVVEENAVGIEVVKAFGREDTRQAVFTDQADALLAENLAASRLRAKYGPLLPLLPALSVAVLLGYGGRLVADRDITLGTLVAFNSYLALLSAPLQSVSSLSGMAQRAMAGAVRVFAILDTPLAIYDRPGAVDLPGPPAGAPRGPRITFEHVSFSYPKTSRPALADVSLDIGPGERVALVGGSGAGKSTLAALLSRAYEPASGRIRIDGHDAAGLTLDSVRRAVTLVPAEPVLFAATLRENVALGSPGAGDHDIRYALWVCAAAGFADRLPDGLGTVVGERGTTLSGGQRQRIALARALLSRPRVLILDDALSQLDALTEATVLDRLGSMLGDISVLILAGRSAHLRLADRVLAIEGGQVAAADPAGVRS